MNIQRISLGLTVINVVLLIFLLVQAKTAAVLTNPTIRTQRLEIVDDAGRIRSLIQIKSGGTVELDLFDQKGIVKVKLGAGEGGSGLFLADETTDTGVQIIARQKGTPEEPATTGIIFTGANGLKRLITP